MSTTRCPSCGATKSTAEFGRNRSLKDGLSFYCLECNRGRNNAWYREHRRALGKDVRDHSWIPAGFRWCQSCEQPVSHEEYTRSTYTSSGFGSRCKACKSAADSDAYFYRRYRLTRREVEQLRTNQDDRCAICRATAPQHLDHDHGSGATRQLLCQRCNNGLGLFRDDPFLLHVAAFYVESHRERQALTLLQEAAADDPDGPSRETHPPVGSQRRPGGTRGPRGAGRSSGARRRKTAGEADG